MLQHLPNVSVSHAAGTHSRRHPREIESYEKKNVNRELIDKRERGGNPENKKERFCQPEESFFIGCRVISKERRFARSSSRTMRLKRNEELGGTKKETGFELCIIFWKLSDWLRFFRYDAS